MHAVNNCVTLTDYPKAKAVNNSLMVLKKEVFSCGKIVGVTRATFDAYHGML